MRLILTILFQFKNKWMFVKKQGLERNLTVIKGGGLGLTKLVGGRLRWYRGPHRCGHAHGHHRRSRHSHHHGRLLLKRLMC